MIETTLWQWNIPEHFNIGDACTRHAKGPLKDKTAITIEDAKSGIRSLSYAELNTHTNCFAGVLSRLDLLAGERVLIRLPNTIEYPVCFLGILKVGAIAVPSSHMLTTEELSYLAKDAGVRILITEASTFADIANSLSDIPTLKHVILINDVAFKETPKTLSSAIQCHFYDVLMASSTPIANSAPTLAEDPAYLVYTSGTTGYPKGVLHAHRALIGRTPSGKYWFNFQAENERILHTGKFNWTYVLGTGLMDPLYHGHSVVLYEGPNEPSIWIDLIARHQCTTFIGVPTIYRQILQKTDFTHNDTPTLRHCMSAGEHLSGEILDAWQMRFRQCVYEALGMSECSYYLSQHPNLSNNPSIPVKAGSAGKPQPGHNIALLDGKGNPVKDNEEGMMSIPLDDPGLFLEYWQLPEETASSRKQGYFLTGDYAKRDEDGYLWFMGRRDDIINSFGYRISPHEIERVLKMHPDIADAVAIEEVIDDNKCIVTACVILHEHKSVSEDKIINYCTKHLARYKVPKKVRFLSNFPRTRNGKILRKDIRLAPEN